MVHPLFPGSFDPPTLGHLDLIERGLRLFGRLTVAVAENPDKRPLFSVAERLELLRTCLGAREGLTLTSFGGLVVDFARAHGHALILRGLRDTQDFEFEYRMALTNRTLAPEVETLFLMPSLEYTFTSSSLMKQILEHGGDASAFLPGPVIEALRGRASP